MLKLMDKKIFTISAQKFCLSKPVVATVPVCLVGFFMLLFLILNSFGRTADNAFVIKSSLEKDVIAVNEVMDKAF